MAINKKLINFKKQEEFDKRNEAGEILETSIVFIDDTKKIVTHGTEFDCSADWNTLKNKPLIGDDEVVSICANPNFEVEYTTTNNYKVNNDKDFPMVIGDTYKIVLDGVVYDNLICKIIDSNTVITDGTANKMFPEDGHIFIYKSTYSPNIAVKTDKNTVSFEIFHYTQVKKIDTNLLPEYKISNNAISLSVTSPTEIDEDTVKEINYAIENNYSIKFKVGRCYYVALYVEYNPSSNTIIKFLGSHQSNSAMNTIYTVVINNSSNTYNVTTANF